MVTCISLASPVGALIGDVPDGSQLLVMGENGYGQLGNGQTVYSGEFDIFRLPTGVNAVSVMDYTSSTFVLGSDGQLYGAGRNNYGQLGNGTMSSQSVPVKFVLPDGLTAVDLYYPSYSDAMYVLASDGQVYGAGANVGGNLGIGNFNDQSTASRFLLPAGVTAQSIHCDEFCFTAFVKGSDGAIYGAGSNMLGSMGAGAALSGIPDGPRETPQPILLPAGAEVVKILSTKNGAYNTFFLLEDGRIYGVGENDTGQLGIGNEIEQFEPQQFPLPIGETAVDITVLRTYITYVLAASGKVYATGDNWSAQLGDYSYGPEVSIPIEFPLPAGVKALGISHDEYDETIYIRCDDGKVYSAGMLMNRSSPDAPSGYVLTTGLPGGVAVADVKITDGFAMMKGDDNNLYRSRYSIDNSMVLAPLPSGFAISSFVTAILGVDNVFVLGANTTLPSAPPTPGPGTTADPADTPATTTDNTLAPTGDNWYLVVARILLALTTATGLGLWLATKTQKSATISHDTER